MEQVFTINCRALALFLLFVTLNTCQANSGKYKKVGDTVVLSPGSVSASITSITWKHNSNLAVEWYGGLPDFYPKFEDRCTLNVTTGELTFQSVTLKDSGSYTAEINNRVLNPTEIEVISEVPTPTVSESCDAEKTHCVLTCEGITTDAEPVVYSWWSGDVMKSKTKELNITKEEKERSFFCKMENQVSFERSKEVLNPFITSPEDSGNNNNNLYWLFILLVVLVAGVIGFLLYKHRTATYSCEGSQGCTEAMPSSHRAGGGGTPWTGNLLQQLRRVLPCLKTNADAAASSETSPIILPENEPLLNGTSDVVQEPSSLETINETVNSSKIAEDQGSESAQVQSVDLSSISNHPEGEEQSPKDVSIEANSEPEKSEVKEATAKLQPSSSPLGTTQPQEEEEKKSPKDLSLEAVNGTETTPQAQGNQGPPPAESQTSSSSSETTSEKPENQEAPAKAQSSPSPPATRDQSEEERKPTQTQQDVVSLKVGNEPDVQVKPPDQKTHVSTGTINEPGVSSDKQEEQGLPAKSTTSVPSPVNSGQPGASAQEGSLEASNDHDSSQTSSIPEMKPLINDKMNEETQGSSNLETINKTDEGKKSPQTQPPDESTDTNNKPDEISSDEPDDQGLSAKSTTSGPSSSTSGQQPEDSSETSVVDESPPDPEKTTETPNSEALNSNMEEKQENEN